MDAALRAGSGLDYVEEFASAAEWFADHVTRTHMKAPVPSCPDWTVLDLVTHVGNVHSWAATIVETTRRSGELEDRPSSHRPRRVSEWYLAKAEDLYTVLRNVDPLQPTWNFAFGAGVAGFWQRRQTHETLMHGVDLALAGDHEERMPLDLAVDGIDEALTVFLHRMHSRGYAAALDRPIEVRATDAERSWVVEPAPRAAIPAQASPSDSRAWLGTDQTAPVVTPGRREGADRLEGPAALVLKVLWKRARPVQPGLSLVGDEDRILRFLGSRLTA